MSSDLEPFVRTFFLQVGGKLGLPEVPSRREELTPVIAEILANFLKKLGYTGIVDTNSFAERFFDELIEAGVVRIENIRYAGEYCTYKSSLYPEYRNRMLKDDPVYSAAQRVGERFYHDVFRGYLVESGDADPELPALGVAPASSRIVRFSDNQIDDLDARTTELISAVESKNQIGGIAGLRELVIGQLKAGREFIRAGVFRLYFLQITLIQSLQYLAERYEKELVGGLAAALIAELMKIIGIGG